MQVQKELDSKFSNPVCQKCIADHLKKYDGFVDDDGVVHNGFTVPCNGIPEKYLSDHLEALLDEQTKLDAIGLFDPVTWAEEWIKLPNGEPWVARWYQENMLRCSASRRITRCGRRCLEEGTQVMTPAGPVEIQNLKPNDIVYGYNPNKDKVFETSVVDVWDQGLQEVVDLKHRNKTIASCTLKHRWHTAHERGNGRKVRRVYQFYKGIGITRKFIKVPLGNVNEPHAYAIGALLGDGCSYERGNKIYISSENNIVPNAVSKLLGGYTRKCVGNNYTWVLGQQSGQTKETISCNYYNKWCKNRHAHEKTVDLDIIKTWNRKSCLAFLAGLLDTDGSVCQVKEKSGNILLKLDFTMQAKPVIEAIQYLLLALFQYSAVVREDRRDKYKNGSVWYISIKNNLFVPMILKELSTYIHVKRKRYKDSYADLHINNNVKERVGVKIDNNSRQAYCWDISIGTKDNLFLLSNGLVSHNTGKTDAIAVHILHYCFTHKNKKVLIVAPYKSQTEEIVSRIRNFIASNPKLMASVVRDVSSPFYELKFANGSRIRGFSSGTKSGAEGVAIRGQDADRIYLDEADYLSEGDLKAIVAILNTHGHVELWASSTPTGRRAHFWRWCVKTPSYKEFYYPSQVLPHWDKVKNQIKSDYVGNHDAWVHEILAEFGEQTVGVFQNMYTDMALGEYKYEDMLIEPEWIYSIGVDWNSEFGTEIVTVGYDGRGRFKVVDAVNIPKQGWTQLAGIEAVIAMNAKWTPKFIYVDEGHGTTNIELLHKYGYDMATKHPGDPACALSKILKAYNFSSKIDARDPMTKRKIKKLAKPFLVENAVRFFEERRIKISAWDMILRNQLENYIIKHRSVAGVPVYGLTEERVGDHRLDAFMLALVGYKLEMSSFGRAYYDVHVSVSPGFARLHSSKEVSVSPEQELKKRLDRMPQARFDDDIQPVIKRSTHSLPAKTSSERQIPVYRHGFFTDEEDKLLARYRIKHMRKKGRFNKNIPQRTNI